MKKINESTKVTLTFGQLKSLVKEDTMKPEIEKIKAQLEHEGLLSDFDEDGETVPPNITLQGNVFNVYATFNDACVDEPGNTAWDNVADNARRAAARLWEYQQKYGKQGIQFVLLCDAQGPGGYFEFSDLKMSKVNSERDIDWWVHTNAPEDDEDEEDVDECKLNEGAKVTITFKQLKTLVREARGVSPVKQLHDTVAKQLPQIKTAIEDSVARLAAKRYPKRKDTEYDEVKTADMSLAEFKKLCLDQIYIVEIDADASYVDEEEWDSIGFVLQVSTVGEENDYPINYDVAGVVYDGAYQAINKLAKAHVIPPVDSNDYLEGITEHANSYIWWVGGKAPERDEEEW